MPLTLLAILVSVEKCERCIDTSEFPVVLCLTAIDTTRSLSLFSFL